MAEDLKTRIPSLDETGIEQLKPWLKTFKLAAASTVPLEDGEQQEARDAKLRHAYAKYFPLFAGVKTVQRIDELPGKLLAAEWPTLEAAVVAYFSPAEDDVATWLAKLQQRRQGAAETVQAYADEFMALAAKAGVVLEQWTVPFKNGLKPAIGRAMDGHRKYADDIKWIALTSLAKSIELSLKEQEPAPVVAASAEVSALAHRGREQRSAGRDAPRSPSSSPESASHRRPRCKHCGKMGHDADACWTKNPSKAPSWFRPRRSHAPRS